MKSLPFPAKVVVRLLTRPQRIPPSILCNLNFRMYKMLLNILNFERIFSSFESIFLILIMQRSFF